MHRGNAAAVAVCLMVLPATLTAQQPEPYTGSYLRAELGYAQWGNGVGSGLGGAFKLVRVWGRNMTFGLDAGLIFAKEIPYADFAVGADGGMELGVRLTNRLRLLAGAGAGIVTMAGEYFEAYTRLSGGVELALGSSPFSVRAMLSTGVPPLANMESMVLVGVAYRL